MLFFITIGLFLVISIAYANRCHPFYKFAIDFTPVIVATVALVVSYLAYYEPNNRERRAAEDDFIGARNVTCYTTRWVIPRIEEAVDHLVNGGVIFSAEQKEITGATDIVMFQMKQIEFYKIRPPELSDQMGDVLRLTKYFSQLQISGKTLMEKEACTIRNSMQADINKINNYVQVNFASSDERLRVPCGEVAFSKTCDKYMPK